MRDFFWRALLDRDAVAVGSFQVHGGEWRRDVKRDAVLLGQHRHGVGADFVGDVAIGGDAVRAHHHRADLALLHDRARHAVGDQRGWDAVLHQFPRGQPRALQKGARLVGVDVQLLALLDGRADHAQRRAVPAGGQCPGVAMRQHAAGRGKQRGAVTAHRFVGGDVFQVHALRFGDHFLPDAVDREFAERLKLVFHALDRPEQVDRRGPRGTHRVADFFESAPQFADVSRLGIAHAQRNAHRCRYADRRRAAHGHIADRLRHLFIVVAGDVGLFGRQLALIDKAHAFVGPFEGFHHKDLKFEI